MSSHSQFCSTLALLVLSLLLVSPPPSTLAAAMPIVTRIRKDPATSLYTVSIRKGGAPLVLDLAGPLVWSSCANEVHRRFPCVGSLCQVANRNRPSFCPYNANGRPGSKDKYCTCTNNPYNPVARHCGYGHVTVLSLAANATDGKSPLYPVSFSAFGSCAEEGLLTSFPSGATGVAGLSRSPLSLPLQVASSLKVAKQFALCLPSGGGGDGAAIFGGGPFQLMASPPVEVAEGLTPLKALQAATLNAATLNPARMWHATNSLGTVAPGKLADLVLLDANPLEDVTNTTTIRAVVANGRYFDRTALDQLLADVRANAKQEP